MKNCYDLLLQRRSQGKKSLAVLIDPDKTEKLSSLLQSAKNSPPDFFFVGGSIISNGNLENCIGKIRSSCSIPVILFPGNAEQISSNADSILLLSVISGRNPDLLIGRQIAAALELKKSKLEIIPTGYVLIESGSVTAVNSVTNTPPIPHFENSLAVHTALAGEQLGLRLIYLEAGSGAKNPVSNNMISEVKKNISIPLIVGGGLKTKSEIIDKCEAGADLIVVGNRLEENPELISEFSDAVHSYQTK